MLVPLSWLKDYVDINISGRRKMAGGKGHQRNRCRLCGVL